MKFEKAPLTVALTGLLLCQNAVVLPRDVSWDWQLQTPLDLSVDVDALALDPDEVTAADIAALTSRGVFTICYVSVGTIEVWRDDVLAFPDHVIGNAYDGWAGEQFLDIRAPALRPILEARFRRCADMGFQAIEADNIDLHINDTGFGLTWQDVVAYYTFLSKTAHALGLEIAQKNAPDLAAKLAPYSDFAMTENCITDGWCGDMSKYAQTGRAVLAAEYQRPERAQCQAAQRAGYSAIIKRRDLTAWRRPCTP